jgi:hypothetical protein
MKSPLRIGLTALAAVLVLSAVVAATASAAPEWYAKKAGVFKKVTTAVKVEFEASKLAMIDNLGGAYEGMSCTTSNFGHGTVEAAGAGKIETFSAENGKTQCKGGKIKENGEGNVCEEHGIEEMTAINAPWKTQLSAEGTSIRASISSESGTPGFRFKCKTIGGTSILVTCEGNTSAHAFSNATAGLVEAEFESKSPRTTCAKQKEAGEWKGTLKVKPSKVEKEAGVEALKVE